MAKLEKYKGSVEMQSGMKPMGSYPLMEAHDVIIAENGARLDEAFEPIVLSAASTGKDAFEAFALYELYGKKVIWEMVFESGDTERCEMIGFNSLKFQMYFLCTITKQIITIDFAMAEHEDTLENFLIYEDIGGDIDESILAQINTNKSDIAGIKTSVTNLGNKDTELGNKIVTLENDMNTRFNNLPVTKDGDTPYIKEVNGVKYWHVGDNNLWVQPTGEKGDKGDKGDTGKGFSISCIYNSVAEMNASAATDGYSVGDFVLVTSDVEDEDNAKLYVKDTARSYKFLTDMSGATGIQGKDGVSVVGVSPAGNKTVDGRKVDTYNVYDSNGNVVGTLDVPNGIDGKDGKDGKDGEDGTSVEIIYLDKNSSADDFVNAYKSHKNTGARVIYRDNASEYCYLVGAQTISGDGRYYFLKGSMNKIIEVALWLESGEVYISNEDNVVAVETEEEMDEILNNATDNDVGKQYLYTGDTTPKYGGGRTYRVLKE